MTGKIEISIQEKVEVVGSKIPLFGGFSQYFVKVKIFGKNEEILVEKVVKKRFSDFRRMWLFWNDLLGSIEFPLVFQTLKFPSKGFLGLLRFDDNVIESRRKQMEEIMQAAAKSPKITNHISFYEFFGVETKFVPRNVSREIPAKGLKALLNPSAPPMAFEPEGLF